ncbi:MAG: hypothetical protein AB1Z23_11630 [Eubacteriales bacterium]
MKLHSLKNEVYREGDKVMKRFADKEAFFRELETAQKLRECGVSVAKVIESSDNQIIYEWIEGEGYHNLVDSFEQKHARALVDWLVQYYHATGRLRGDVNLRNFIYNDELNKCIGVDFEENYTEGEEEKDFGRIIAFASTYEPSFTENKKNCIKLLMDEFERVGADKAKIKESYLAEIYDIIKRRTNRFYDLNYAIAFLEDTV